MIDQNNIYSEKIKQPILTAQPEIKAIIEQVLQLEKERLSNKNLQYINDDILKIIKENIQ